MDIEDSSELQKNHTDQIMSVEGLYKQDQPIPEEQYLGYGTHANTSDLWVDINELIDNTIYTEEQERVHDVVENLRSVKKDKQKSTRQGHYNTLIELS